MAKDSEGQYARILRRLIDDPDFCARSSDARHVHLTLLIAPEFRVLGIAPLDMDGLVHRTGLRPRAVAVALDELEQHRVIRRDARWCWIRNHLRFQEGSEAWAKSRMTMMGLSRRVNELPAGIAFLPEFIEMYKSLGFNFDLQPRFNRHITPPPIPLPIPPPLPPQIIQRQETPETPETPHTPETPDSPKETVAVVVAVPAPPALEVPSLTTLRSAHADPIAVNPRLDTFHGIATRHVTCFNAVFRRKLGVSPEIVEKTRTLLRATYHPWQIVALPIMVEAQGVSGDMRRRLTPQIILRDGKHGRTVAGQTFGATHWLERALSRLDQTSLDDRLMALARQFGVLSQLMQMGVSVNHQETA